MFNKLTILLITILSLSTCTRYIHDFSNLIVEDGQYDTEFPHRNCAAELSNISNTTKMLTCVGYYTEYQFSLENQFTLQDIKIDEAVKTVSFNNNSTGTATIIHKENNQVAMLTCAHIVNVPEKIITYFEKPYDNYIASISFLTKKMIYCSEIATEDIEILVLDDKIDIAILGAKTSETSNLIPVLDYPVGNTKQLNWGSFVYLFGFPRGYKMISHGITSFSKPRPEQYFYADSPFNRGFSGGLVIGILDGVPNFEVIGIATSAAAEFYQYLSPRVNNEAEDFKVTFEPYEGEIFTKKLEMIMYGVTQITSINAITGFWKENRDYLESRGYYLNSFFERQ
ncbi:MAG: serine protease [Fidelibacterota bacterium]